MSLTSLPTHFTLYIQNAHTEMYFVKKTTRHFQYVIAGNAYGASSETKSTPAPSVAKGNSHSVNSIAPYSHIEYNTPDEFKDRRTYSRK